ncbi:MAG: NusG domain II-containing protein [Eubacteriales bacterium]|nr:NusG domain II-containing protein [Eubacteriales bacterium]
MVKKADVWFIVITLLLGIALFVIWKLSAKPGKTAVISVDGEIVAELPMNSDTTYTVRTEQGMNVVEVKDAKLFVSKADCRDQICVGHRAISDQTETIVCLPHKLVLEVKE